MTRLPPIIALLVVMLVATSRAHAAPWSFELPAGYTEEIGAADRELDQLREVPRTVSVDAQGFLSPDRAVRLTRLTWQSQFDVVPTRGNVEKMDRELSTGNGKAGTIIRESRELVGELLVGEQIVDIGDLRVDMRRLYAAGRDRTVTMFMLVCAGPKDALAECDRAQQTMRLVLPDQTSLTASSAASRGTAYIAGYVTGGAVLLLVIVWLVRRARRRRN